MNGEMQNLHFKSIHWGLLLIKMAFPLNRSLYFEGLLIFRHSVVFSKAYVHTLHLKVRYYTTSLNKQILSSKIKYFLKYGFI